MPSSLNGTGVTFNDATTLQTGIIPAGNLASNSVTAVKIADANVTTAKLATNERMTTANVLSATAGASAGAVGSYAFARRLARENTFSFGNTVAGSGLRSHGLPLLDGGTGNQSGVTPGNALSGTWRAMGTVGSLSVNANYRPGSLWLRIS